MPAAVFLILSIALGLLTMALNPPLRGPDEPAHLVRALAIAQGEFIPRSVDGRTGIFMPANFHGEFEYFNRLRETSVSERPNYAEVFRSYFARDRETARDKAPVFVSYEGSQIYSPIPYLPYAAAALLAKPFRPTFVTTLYLLRITGLLVASAILAYAIAVVPALQWMFVCVAMLPTALYQRAVISVDGVALSATLLVVALSLKAMRRPVAPWLRSAWMAISSLTKPPQLAFVLLEAMRIPLRDWKTQWRSFVLVTAPAIALGLLWLAASSRQLATLDTGIQTQSADYLSVLARMRVLLVSVGQFARAAVTSLDFSGELWRQLIGVFGWLDVPMSNYAYPVLSFLLLASFFDRLGLSPSERVRVAIISFLTGLSYCLAVFVAFFVAFTPAGAERIYGLQGRYFIFVLPLVALPVSALVNRSPGSVRPLVALAASFCSFAFMVEALWRVHWI